MAVYLLCSAVIFCLVRNITGSKKVSLEGRYMVMFEPSCSVVMSAERRREERRRAQICAHKSQDNR